MNAIRTTIRRTGDRTRRLQAHLVRTGLRPLALGALLLATSTAAVLATANTPPTITSATVTPTALNEGQAATLRVTFTDPDPGDLHTVRVKWHDNWGVVPSAEVIQLPAGQLSFTLPHTFKDSVSGPSGSQLQITVYDRQTAPGPGSPNDNADGAGQDVIFVPIQVNNVAPNITPSSVTVKRQGRRQVVVEGDVVDLGAHDTVRVGAAWWDPTSPAPTACSMGKDGRHFKCEHTYGASVPAGTYDIFLDAWDDDGGQGVYTTSVQLP